MSLQSPIIMESSVIQIQLAIIQDGMGSDINYKRHTLKIIMKYCQREIKSPSL